MESVETLSIRANDIAGIAPKVLNFPLESNILSICFYCGRSKSLLSDSPILFRIIPFLYPLWIANCFWRINLKKLRIKSIWIMAIFRFVFWLTGIQGGQLPPGIFDFLFVKVRVPSTLRWGPFSPRKNIYFVDRKMMNDNTTGSGKLDFWGSRAQSPKRSYKTLRKDRNHPIPGSLEMSMSYGIIRKTSNSEIWPDARTGANQTKINQYISTSTYCIREILKPRRQ